MNDNVVTYLLTCLCIQALTVYHVLHKVIVCQCCVCSLFHCHQAAKKSISAALKAGLTCDVVDCLNLLFNSNQCCHYYNCGCPVCLWFYHNPGSFSASSCEGRTVNSYWLSRRKWRHTKHGGLMAKSWTSRSQLHLESSGRSQNERERE